MGSHPAAEEQPAMGPSLKLCAEPAKEGEDGASRGRWKRGPACRAVLFSLWALSRWKEVFYREMQKVVEQKTGIDVSVKSFHLNKVPERREVAKDLENSATARHFGDFELAMDQRISLVGTATERQLPIRRKTKIR